jgi:hypothetical protein
VDLSDRGGELSYASPSARGLGTPAADRLGDAAEAAAKQREERAVERKRKQEERELAATLGELAGPTVYRFDEGALRCRTTSHALLHLGALDGNDASWQSTSSRGARSRSSAGRHHAVRHLISRG